MLWIYTGPSQISPGPAVADTWLLAFCVWGTGFTCLAGLILDEVSVVVDQKESGGAAEAMEYKTKLNCV